MNPDRACLGTERMSRIQIDLFRQKLALYKLSEYLPDYTGPNTYEATTQYLARSFAELYTNPKRALIMHLTCATGALRLLHLSPHA